MSKILEFPNLMGQRRPHPEDDCNHNITLPGKGYQTVGVGTLRYEYDTDVCQFCGAFVTTGTQYDAFKEWLLKQPIDCFRVDDIRLATSTLKIAEDTSKKFNKSPSYIYKACLALLNSGSTKDEEWGWGGDDSESNNLILPLYLHPFLYLSVDAWASLTEMPMNILIGKTINAGLRQYAAYKFNVCRSLESYLLL